MTQSDPPPSGGAALGRLAWRLLKGMAWVLGGGLFLLILSLVALQTHTGKTGLIALLEKQLSTPHQRVILGPLHGWVPSNMQLDHLVLIDPAGVWLEVAAVRFAWSPADLLQGRIRIREMSAGHVHLYRQPKPPPVPVARRPPKPAAKATGWQAVTALPSFLLDRLHIPFIILDTADDQEVRFSLEGDVTQTMAQTKTGGPVLTARLALRPLNAGDTHLNVKGQLTSGATPEAFPLLEMTAEGREDQGWLAKLAALPQAGEMAFHLAGKAPISHWEGALTVSMTGLGTVQSRLSVHPFSTGPEAHPSLQWQGTAQIAPGRVPKPWASLLAPTAEAPPTGRFALHLAMPSTQQMIVKRVELGSHAATLHTQGRINLLIQHLDLATTLEIPHLASLTPVVGRPLEGRASVSMQVDGPWQRPHLKGVVHMTHPGMVGLRANGLKAHLEGRFPGGIGDALNRLRLTGHGAVSGLHRVADPASFRESLTWSSEMTVHTKVVDGIQQAVRVHLAAFDIKDQALTVRFQGEMDPRHGTGHGAFHGTLDRLSHLEALASLAGEPFSVAGLEGDGRVSGEIQWPGFSDLMAGVTPVRMAITGAVSDLHGLPPPAGRVLGPEIEAQLDGALWPGRTLSLTGMAVHAEALQSHGDLEINLVDGGVSSTVQTELMELDSLSAWAGVPLSGAFTVDTQLSGTMTDPVVQVTGHAPALEISRRALKNVHAEVSLQDPAGTPHGRVALEFEDAAGEVDEQAARLALSYRVAMPWLHIADLRVDLPGGSLRGQRLEAELAQGLLEGQVLGRSDDPDQLADWLLRPPSTLTATKTPSSPPSVPPRARKGSSKRVKGTLEMRVQWMPHNGRQDVEATLHAAFLRGAFGLLEKGRFKARLTDIFGAVTGKAELTLGKLLWGDLKLRTGRLTASGGRALTNLTLHLKGRGQETFKLEAQGDVGMDAQGVVRGRLAELTGDIGQDALQLEQATRITLTPPDTLNQATGATLTLDPLLLRYGPARLRGHAYQDAQRLDVALDVRFPLGIAARFGGPDLRGTALLDATLTGTPANPEGRVNLLLEHVRIHDPTLGAMPPVDLMANAFLEGGQANAHVVLKNLTATPITALLLLPVQMDFSPFRFGLMPHGRIGGTLNADNRLAPLARMAALDTQKLDGHLNVALSLGGTVSAPELRGDISLKDGSYEHGMLGTALKKIRFKVTAHGQEVTLDTLHASDGGRGLLQATGHLSLDPDQQFPFQVDAKLKQAHLVHQDELQSTVSGVIGVRGTARRLEVTSDLTNDEFLFYLPDVASTDIEVVAVDSEIRNGLDLTDKTLPPVQGGIPVVLDMRLRLPHRVFARGRGLESEWQGDLTIRGSAEEPLVLGELSVRKGFFEFLDQRFELRKGVIAFDGAHPPRPSIDVEAESQAEGIVALLRLQGPVSLPRLTLTSEPPLPQDEILSRLLFGRGSQQLNPAQAIGLLAAVDKLRKGGPGVLGKARDSLGIDRLELGGDSVATGSVKAGKYLNDKVFLGVERGLQHGSGKISVELELTPSITVETQTDELNNSGVGIHWRYDY